MKVKCPHCKVSHEATDEYAGREVTCRECKKAFIAKDKIKEKLYAFRSVNNFISCVLVAILGIVAIDFVIDDPKVIVQQPQEVTIPEDLLLPVDGKFVIRGDGSIKTKPFFLDNKSYSLKWITSDKLFSVFLCGMDGVPVESIASYKTTGTSQLYPQKGYYYIQSMVAADWEVIIE